MVVTWRREKLEKCAGGWYAHGPRWYRILMGGMNLNSMSRFLTIIDELHLLPDDSIPTHGRTACGNRRRSRCCVIYAVPISRPSSDT